MLNYNGGSAVPTLNRNDIHRVVIIIPPISVVTEFCKIAIRLYDKIKVYEHETQTLTSLRDSLLPKLMKGEIKITIENDDYA